MKKRIIVLGSRGFVGRGLVDHLTETFKETIVTGLSSLELDLEKGFHSPLFDISPETTTLVICSGLKRNFGETTETFNRNLKIAENLYNLTNAVKFERVIYLSSCAVYGEDVAHEIISEENVLTPTSFYGISKTSTEFLLQKSCSDRLVIIRPPTIYGDPNHNNYDPYGFLSKISKGEILGIWGDGTELREFLYIKDLHTIIEKLIPMKLTGVFNTCSGKSYSFVDIIDIAKKLTGKIPNLEFKARSKDKVDHNFKADKIKSVLPDFTFTTLNEGMNLMFKKEFKNE